MDTAASLFPICFSTSLARCQSVYKAVRKALFSAAVVAAVLWAFPMASHATVVISNSPISTNGGSQLSNVDWKALIFTTGSSASQVTRVDLGLNPFVQANVPSLAKVEIALFGVAAGVPTAQQASTGLLDVNILQLQGNYTFTVSPAFNLAANTSYALVIRSDSNQIKWGNVSGSQPTGSGGFTYNALLVTGNSGLNWVSAGAENALQLHVTMTPVSVPVFSPWALLVFGVLLAGVGLHLQVRRPG